MWGNKIMCIDFYNYSPAGLLGRTTLIMFVYHVRVSKKIPRAMIEKVGQLCFEKRHSDRLVLHFMLNGFLRIAF